MLDGFRKNGIVDARLMCAWDLTDGEDIAKASPVFDILEQGGFSDSAQFQLELTEAQSEGVTATLTIASSATADGTFVDCMTLTTAPREDGEDMSWERISAHCKRFIKVTPTLSEATGKGKLIFRIAV